MDGTDGAKVITYGVAYLGETQVLAQLSAGVTWMR